MLNIEEVNSRTKTLKTFILDLASEFYDFSDDNVVKKSLKILTEVYYSQSDEDKFRHEYSKIFAIITVINNDDSKSLDKLTENLSFLKQTIFDDIVTYPYIDISVRRGFLKLYDHINLDVARIHYTDSIKQTTESLYKNTEQMTKTLENEKINLEEIKRDVKNTKIDHITILGIFSSIVLVFVGGMTFSTSILKFLNKVPIYKLFFIGAFISLILFDVIWLLLNFITKLTDKKIKGPNYIGYIFNGIMCVVMYASFIYRLFNT